jgi:hypothetical protein
MCMVHQGVPEGPCRELRVVRVSDEAHLHVAREKGGSQPCGRALIWAGSVGTDQLLHWPFPGHEPEGATGEAIPWGCGQAAGEWVP